MAAIIVVSGSLQTAHAEFSLTKVERWNWRSIVYIDGTSMKILK